MVNTIDVVEAIRLRNGKHKWAALSEATEAIGVDN
jgi:hypothetical protein